MKSTRRIARSHRPTGAPACGAIPRRNGALRTPRLRFIPPATALLILAFLGPGCFLVRDQTQCTDQICLFSRQGTDYVLNTEFDDIYVQNPLPYDVTVSIEFEANNMGLQMFQPATETYKGQSITKVARARVTNPKLPWAVRYTYKWNRGSIHAVHDSTYEYHLPFPKGVSYVVSQGYDGEYSHRDQNRFAVDFRMPEGSLICAARPGLVIEVKEDSDEGGSSDEFNDKANYVRVLQEDGTIADYSHLQLNGALVRDGETVQAGDTIALSGNTGWSSGPHLHFRVMKTVNGFGRNSCRIKFRTKEGLIESPVEGTAYTAM